MPSYEDLSKAQVLEEVDDPNGTIAPVLDTLWLLNGAQPTMRLRFLHTKMQAIDIRLREEAKRFDATVGQEGSFKRSQVWEHWNTMRGGVLEEITTEQRLVRSQETAVAAPILATSSIPPPPLAPDPTDPRYDGYPYPRSPR